MLLGRHLPVWRGKGVVGRVRSGLLLGLRLGLGLVMHRGVVVGWEADADRGRWVGDRVLAVAVGVVVVVSVGGLRDGDG